MSRQRIWIINGALGLLLVWGGTRLRSDWNAFGATHDVSRLPATASRGDVKAAVPAAAPVEQVVAWTDIASRSPFSFDRNDANLEVAEVVAAPVATPKPILLATFLLGSERLAMMGKPGSDGRSSSRVKVGET